MQAVKCNVYVNGGGGVYVSGGGLEMVLVRRNERRKTQLERRMIRM